MDHCDGRLKMFDGENVADSNSGRYMNTALPRPSDVH